MGSWGWSLINFKELVQNLVLVPQLPGTEIIQLFVQFFPWSFSWQTIPGLNQVYLVFLRVMPYGSQGGSRFGWGGARRFLKFSLASMVDHCRIKLFVGICIGSQNIYFFVLFLDVQSDFRMASKFAQPQFRFVHSQYLCYIVASLPYFWRRLGNR